ncbi:PAS domain S-box protein [Oculatella sp. LEGE 06141]|uniref:PAS domain S-box protein n=1 Tax=Oculatella sp. LEGE 06141 TaxID=1828648 RepID=UPI0018802DB6|nr:PAS domain S-box protein [Oculatella sp. LEGE 06141]MBE9181050.1 PAS domain S-box protein [Oculatella sp. LEGE 06141]
MLLGLRSAWQRYAIALLVVSTAFGLKLAFDPLLKIESPFLIFLGAVMVSAWYGGRGAGWLATLVATLIISYFFLSPFHALVSSSLGQNLRVVLFLVEGGLISLLIAAFHDTKQEAKTSITSLTEREEQFRQLTENIHEVFWMSDAVQQTILYVSPAYEAIWGRTCQSLYDNSNGFLDTIHAEDRERIKAAIDRQWQGESTAEEYRIVRPDGTVRWIWDRAFPIYDSSGQFYRMTGVAEDITERKDGESALRTSEKRYRAFVEQSSEGIWCIELEQALSVHLPEEAQIQQLHQFGYVAECNNVTAQMYGFTQAEDVVGKRITEFLTSATADTTESIRKFIRAGYRVNNSESCQTDQHGQTRYFLNNVVGIVVDETLVQVWGSQRDITERRRSQTLLGIQNRILEMVATGVKLTDVLQELAQSIEAYSDGAICTILLADEAVTTLHLTASASLPETYQQFLSAGLPVGHGFGTCSSAAARRERVVVGDIATDPVWHKYRDLVLPLGLKSSWSVPIFGSNGEVLGAFGLYYRIPRCPSLQDDELVEISRKLAGIAIERQRAERILNQLLLREQTARAEVELQRSYMHSLLMQAPALISIQRGADHVYEFANSLFCQMMRDREFLGKSVREVFPELQDQGFFSLLDRVYTTGEPYFGKEVSAKLDRRGEGGLEEGFFNFVYQPMYGLDGTVEGVMTFAFEVTDHVLSRQQAEMLAKYLRSQQRALRESEERYRSLIEATSQIIWNTEASGAFVANQPRWSEFTGQTSDELKGWGWLSAVHPEDQSHTASAWIAALATRSMYEVEQRLRRCDGDYRYMHVRAIPVLESDGTVREWIGVHTDITDRKRAEAEREQLLVREQAARAEAETANRTKDEFLATLSHELRTPLNAMLGWTQLLRTRRFDDQTSARALETIERNSRSLAQLIEDVLDVSRIITGKLRLNIQTVSLEAVVRAAIDTVHPAAAAREIPVEFIASEAPINLQGDASRLQQVVWNLLSNAIKFTSRGGQVQVRLDTVIQAEEKPTEAGSEPIAEAVQSFEYARISVSDTGQGIRPEFLPHVFDRFRQADGSLTRSHNGLGLGLAIVRHLVELHGGTVRADSPGEGQGATFVVTLPIGQWRTTAHASGLDERSTASLQPVQHRNTSLDGLHVLVVDDEADARELLTTALTQYGAQVTPAASASEAIAILVHVMPDVLVSDIGMPDQDGYTLIKNVRSLKNKHGEVLPAVALTAYARSEDRDRALAAGFQHHISKPISPDELAAVVANLACRAKS